METSRVHGAEIQLHREQRVQALFTLASMTTFHESIHTVGEFALLTLYGQKYVDIPFTCF